jgi:UDP-N-acetylmuramoylalanine--D-glutamate ligase
MFQCVADYFRNKKILILGFGREGRSSYNYIRKFFPNMPLTIADLKEINIEDENVELICGEKYLDCLEGYDIVLKSPGISFKNVRIPQGVEVTCQTDLFLRYAPCVKVGITGTKGKTTTSTLIYGILCTAGVPACLIGNMGVPVFDCLAKVSGKTAVIEMSSHQLEFTHASPHIAVLTNIYEEHLDHYNGFEGYVNAKLNIFRKQTENDYFIYNADQDYNGFFEADEVKSKLIKVSANDDEGNEFYRKLDGINERLIGSHNKQDIFFAAAAAHCLGINDEAIEKGIRNFKGIPHRMEPIGTYEGIKFYNDSIATIPHAVMCALEALRDVDTLIIGGMDRGLDYTQFACELYNNQFRNLICLPETGHRIAADVNSLGSNKNVICVESMEQAVDKAFEVTKKGCSCILSPAAASYNRYKDFEEKGAHFISLVRSHG